MKRTGTPRKKLLLGAFLSVSLWFSLVVSVKADVSTWAQTYDRDASIDWAYSLVATSDGGYAMVGWTSPYAAAGGNYDFWLVKTDALGNMQWNQTYGGDGGDSPESLIATSDGGYAIIGTTDSFGAGNTDLWLIKTDADGNVEWTQTYGGPTAERNGALIATSDGGYALAGGTNMLDVGSGDVWLIKTDVDGNMEWEQIYGGEGADSAQSLISTPDGGYAIAGGTISFSDEDDFWLIKTDENGFAPVVPEATWVIMPLLVTATIAIFISKKKLQRQWSKNGKHTF